MMTTLLVVIAHQFAVILVLPPLWQPIGDIDRPPLVKDMALCLQLLWQSLDSSASSVLARMIFLGFLARVFAVGSMVLLVLLLGFFVGSREVESGRETDHHVSTLVKHG
jgi:hypothetical protein